MLNPPSNTKSTMDSQRPGLEDKRPSLIDSKRTSSRRLVDFDSDQLLSMEEIRDNVRLTASKLLNDLDTSDEEEEEDYEEEQDQLPNPEDARLYAGRLLGRKRSGKSPGLLEKTHSIRTPINVMRSLRIMKDMRSERTFSSDIDAMSMELDMDAVPRKRRMSGHKLLCIVGFLALVGVIATIMVFFNRNSNADATPAVVSSPPEEPESARMQAVVDLLVSTGVSDSAALQTSGTPQRQAAEWIANTDTLQYDLVDDEAFLIQRYAITVLYYALNGREWEHQLNFLSPEEECKWYQDIPTRKVDDVYSIGVTCNAYLQVETLLLPGNKLVGSLPPELSVLTALDFVSLKHNKILGSVPDSYKALSNLEYFDLQHNQMSGSLPSWMGETMKNLRSLSLSDNKFEGVLPESMTKMEHLTTLAIDDNNFSGDIASVVNDLDALKYLYADNNAFDSTIDISFLVELEHLREVDLSGNQLKGDGLPLHLFLMKQLRVLDLHDNALEGRLLDDIPQQSSLEFLSLYGNDLTGSIPKSIHHLGGLKHLDLSRNQFSGLPPDSISYLEGLEYLYLSDNPFDSGEIPKFYQDLTNLQEFSMAKAMRTGTIPEWFASLDNLMLLDLSENELTGTIPDPTFDLPALRFLLLHRNQLKGEVEAGIIRADKLDMFTTDRNEIKDDWTEICILGRPEFLSADCGGNFEKVYCTCCTVCCEDSNPECNDEIVLANLDARWETNFTRTAYNFGPNSIFESGERAESANNGAER